LFEISGDYAGLGSSFECESLINLPLAKKTPKCCIFSGYCNFSEKRKHRLNLPIQPGLLVLQGNRFELLRDTVFAWLAQHPLQPLEEEIFLVQSNGVSQWLKMALAQQQGICAGIRLELPARFLWRSFRQVLGSAEVPANSPLERHPMVWRLMALLPHCVPRPGFELLHDFWHALDALAQFQLCQCVADLFDQYQVYRSDWLHQWAQGCDDNVPTDQHWQPRLWRELLLQLSDAQRASIRPALHDKFIQAMTTADPQKKIPQTVRRVVVFGMSHLPLQTLQAVAALAKKAQVLLVVNNPCRFHWADIFSSPTQISKIDPADLHHHAHPLLAAWGRQTGDFMRQLEAFGDLSGAMPKVEIFDDSKGGIFLTQVQAHIRDMTPIEEHPKITISDADRSIVFHVAHSAQREVEILHDQLLELLVQGLTPRDIVVMVPDIKKFSAAINAVFGQYLAPDARHIPFDIADMSLREQNPLIRAVQALLQLPAQRCTFAQVRNLLEQPAIAARFGVPQADLPQLTQWLLDAGVRWGLNTSQRSALGLQACGDQNSWLFGMRRLLLGYASGQAFEGIEPFTDLGGLDAALAGSVAALVEALLAWWEHSEKSHTPTHWNQQARALLNQFLAPVDETERLSLSALHSALEQWVSVCDAAHFDEKIPLAVFCQAWFDCVDEPGLQHRFLNGGVTFCTLLPMRAIPFEVVCLLGMNEGEFPRPTQHLDFDLMKAPGLSRPGDRSRFDDDRQLMLDAVLSARRVLYMSWTGRSERDNTEQPPSVLVSQWRDYLAAGWSADVVANRTTEHPLQPFSRRYFEGTTLFTHALEWRTAHEPVLSTGNSLPPLPLVGEGAPQGAGEGNPVPPSTTVDLTRLARFLANPVKDFFRHQLGVVWPDIEPSALNEESFSVSGLAQYQWVRRLVAQANLLCSVDPEPAVMAAVQSLQRGGQLPMAALAQREQAELVDAVLPMLRVWRALRLAYPQPQPTPSLTMTHAGFTLKDKLVLWKPEAGSSFSDAHWRHLEPRHLCPKNGPFEWRAEVLLPAWLQTVFASACGVAAPGVWVGSDASAHLPAMPQATAQQALQSMLEAFEQNQTNALPFACRSALAWLSGGHDAAQKTFEGSTHFRGEGQEPCLARLYPNYETLCANGQFTHWATTLFTPFQRWLKDEVQVAWHGL
jgi:exodeoxyribonuclease V gamma subunit